MISLRCVQIYEYVLAALSVSNGNHAAGNYRTSEGCTEEIDVLYD